MIKTLSNGYHSGQKSLRALPTGIWILGFASMSMDISSELLHSLLPIFLTTVLGVSMITVGILEGIAEATAAITKVFSGVLSDYLRKRKPLLVIGYGLATLTKPIFPLASSVSWIFGAHIVDRIGKGIRGAPRDALVADIAPPALHGAAYGLRQALDSMGSFIGPLLAFLLMLWFVADVRTVMWFAAVPALLSVVVLVFYLREPEPAPDKPVHTPLSFADAKRLDRRYWFVVLLGAIFALARFSEAFLILRAQDVGLEMAYLPLVLVAMCLCYALFAFPAGAAADHMSTRSLLLLGLLLLIVADILLAFAQSPLMTFIGAGFWGLHMAFTQGLLAKLVANTAPVELRGSAFGIFNLMTGIALLFASTIAGLLWSLYGASFTFFAGAGFAALSTIGLLVHKLTVPHLSSPH